MMKTTRVLSAISAAALLGISSVAFAQGTGAGGGSPGGATGGTTGSATGGGTGAGTMQREQAPTSPSTQGQAPSRMEKGDRTSPRAQGKDSMRPQAQQGREMGKDSQKSRAQGKEMQRDPTRSQAQERTPGMSREGTREQRMGREGTKEGMGREGTKQQRMGREGTKEGTTVGAAGAGGVNLTAEQRTTVRQQVLTANAPRVDDINFSVNVGTVIPRSVRVVEVPPTLVRIRPAWRGYRYFVYNDEIVIVEPRTLRIVAVLEV
jgi:hypothetical protein